ncbi:MAG TPA: glycoside hydrolase domain-containing protein [Polyangiaceae bacterium]|jgi:hypothetical protein
MRKTHVLGLALFVLAAACSGGDEAVDQSVSELGTRKGIDYAWTHPSISSMKADGYTFAARYLSYDNSKDITASEAHDLKNAGIDVVVVWEATAQAALGGYSQGVSDAKAAESRAKSAGMPSGRPIYFAVDFDASSGEQGALNSYFDGVASVLGRDRTGVYAGYYVVNRLFNAGKIKYAWQTYAWSYGNWDGRAQLRQVQNDISVGNAGACCDKDQAVAADFGQWGYTGGGSDFGLETTGPVVARNADGRLEVFARGGDDSLWHRVQTSPGGGWDAWSDLGGKLTADPVVAENADGRLEVFYRGTDGALWHLSQTSAGGSQWTGHGGLGGTLGQANITVARNADGRLEVFARDDKNALAHLWQKTAGGSYSGWDGLGGDLTSDIVVGTNEDGRLEAFYRGTDFAVWHVFQKSPGGGWSGHASLGGYVDPSLAITRNADGRLELFVRGTNAHVYHMWQKQPNAAWSAWDDLGGDITSDITTTQDEDGRLEIFARGTDDGIWHDYQKSAGGAWAGWASLGGKSTSDIGAFANSDGRLEAFYRGTDKALWHLWQKAANAGWSAHSSLEGVVQP